MAWSVGEKKVETKRMGPNKVVEMRPVAKEADGGADKAKFGPGNGKDLVGGMEMLELDFLLSIVEDTKGNDQNDVMMRKLNFNELLRRGKHNQIDSTALTVYAVNDGDPYGKNIQCEAMKELTKRTVHKNKRGG